MEPQEPLSPANIVSKHLHAATKHVEESNWDRALSAVREAKAADSKNIFLIAFEKQILRLLDIPLAPEIRGEILASLAAMADRAILDSQRRQTSHPDAAQLQQIAREKEEALEKLKAQYFRRANEFIEQSEYLPALAEVRRVYIVDPNNAAAKEYEERIGKLSRQKSGTIIDFPDPSIEQATAIAYRRQRSSRMRWIIGALVFLAAIAIIVFLFKS